jgi:hypothetical protein
MQQWMPMEIVSLVLMAITLLEYYHKMVLNYSDFDRCEGRFYDPISLPFLDTSSVFW